MLLIKCLCLTLATTKLAVSSVAPDFSSCSFSPVLVALLGALFTSSYFAIFVFIIIIFTLLYFIVLFLFLFLFF